MDQVQLLNALHWFLALEKTQVEFYHHLSKHAASKELHYALQRFQKVEEEHVRLLTAKINALGESPGKLAQWLSTAMGTTAPIFGKIMGEATGLVGTARMLKTAYLIEGQAIKDYKKLIASIEDGEIRDLLWHNLVDEESHYLWLMHKAEELT